MTTFPLFLTKSAYIFLMLYFFNDSWFSHFVISLVYTIFPRYYWRLLSGHFCC
uniref:Uncharacterized protein n=1 Tax=Solanum lycopersicum TaxID=4081 RepID=A0A3Q7G7R0_SOLLC